jgi:hypothetical protein
MKYRLDQVSGASGEIGPLLAARRDLARWQSGKGRLVNVVPLTEGALQRRSGTRFVLPLRDQSQPGLLMDFEAGADDSYMLVFNDGVMRVLKDGGFVERSPGAPYELETGFSAAQLASIQQAQSVDQVFIAGAGRPRVLTRLSPTNWTLTDYELIEGPVRLQNTDKTRTITASGTSGNIVLTASTATFLAGHVGSVWRLDEGDLSTIPAWKALEVVTVGARRRNRGIVYEVVVAGTDTGPTAPVHEDGDFSSGAGNTTWRYLFTTSGFCRITAFLSATSVQATVVKRLPDSVQSPGTFRWYEAAWSDVRGWPGTVCLFDGSVVWARGNDVYAAKTSDISSFDETRPEDGAWSVRLLSPDGKLVQIQWLQPAGVLIVGTRSGIWVLRGKEAYERLTTPTLRALPQSSRGSAAAAAVLTEGGAIYVGRSRRDAYFARFDSLGERVEVTDLTAYSRRALFDRAEQIADQRDPYRTIWFRLDTGEVRGLSFIPEQEVLGWHRMVMPGAVIEQIACVQSASETLTELWMIVRRTINGQVRRYVELLQPYFVAADEDAPDASGAWFVDCGLRYQGAPVTTLDGLDHLEGETVAVFADGDERPRCVVTAGVITLDAPASDIVVGLPMPWLIRTLPLDTQTPAGPTAGSPKAAGRIGLHLHESAGGQIAQRGMPASDIAPLGRSFAGGPRKLTSGVVVTSVEPTNDRDAALDVSGDDAFPFTLLGIYPDVDAGSM